MLVKLLIAVSILAASPEPDAPLPDDLAVIGPVVARVHATGVQIYVCARDSSNSLTWKFIAPEAAFSAAGIDGKHYAGPTWENTVDGSKVTGRKLREHAAPDSTAVPWLLIEAVRHSGKGVFESVSFIQRVNTTGGKPPHADTAKPGDEIRVPYRADYVFYGTGSTTRPAR